MERIKKADEEEAKSNVRLFKRKKTSEHKTITLRGEEIIKRTDEPGQDEEEFSVQIYDEPEQDAEETFIEIYVE